MTKETIAFINSFGVAIIGAIVGAIVGGIAAYKGNIKVQQIFFKKKIKLEKLELVKKDIHEYARILVVRDILVKKHINKKIDDKQFEKEDDVYQEDLRIFTRNIMLNSVYIGDKLYSIFKEIEDNINDNIWKYYSIYIDKREEGYIDGIVGEKHINSLLELIKSINKQIEFDLNK